MTRKKWVGGEDNGGIYIWNDYNGSNEKGSVKFKTCLCNKIVRYIPNSHTANLCVML